MLNTDRASPVYGNFGSSTFQEYKAPMTSMGIVGLKFTKSSGVGKLVGVLLGGRDGKDSEAPLAKPTSTELTALSTNKPKQKAKGFCCV